jgi:tRNA-specific adenosine deaminase 3
MRCLIKERTRYIQTSFAFLVVDGVFQMPIATGVPKPYSPGEQPRLDFLAGDTRISKHHPLRHSILNLIREVGEASFDQAEDFVLEEPQQSGSNYLLTSRTLFTSHEPCTMCSMALLHSRVARVMYLIPMGKTGGCGGVACLPRLEEVNHRFGILKWKKRDRVSLGLSEEDWKRLEVGDDLDA